MKIFLKDTKPFVKFMMLIAITMVMTSVTAFATMAFKNDLILVQTISTIVVFGLSVVIYNLLFEEKEIYNKTFNTKQQWWYFLLGMGIMLCAMPTIDIFSQLNNQISFPGDEVFKRLNEAADELVKNMVAGKGVGSLIVASVVVAVLPAFFEEWFFRGTLQPLFINWTKNAYVGILITSIIFSLVHFDIFNFVPRVMLGMILGLLFYYSKCIYVNMVAHFFNNFIVVLGFWLYKTGSIEQDFSSDNTTWYLVVVSVIVLVCWIVWSERKKKTSIVSE